MSHNTIVAMPTRSAVEGGPDAEASRVADLRATELLDSPPEEAFDRITRLAQRVLRADIALVSLVDEDRQFFKSQAGLTGERAESRETPLSHSMCKYAVATGDRFVVADARNHPLVARSGATTDDRVISYAGEPLTSPRGNVLGTLCVINETPRDWTTEDLQLLEELAALAASEIEKHLQARTLDQVETLAERLGDPLDKLGDAVRSAAALADHSEDPRLARLTAQAASRLAPVETIVEDLRAAARAGDERLLSASVIDIRATLLAAARLVTSAAGSGRVRLDLAEGPVWAEADPLETSRALHLMLMTAVAHLGAGEPAAMRVTRDDDEVVVRITSPGHAIPASELLRVATRVSSGQAAYGSGSSEVSVVSRDRRLTIKRGGFAANTAADGSELLLRLPAAQRS